MFSRIFPPRFDNDYHGARIAIWLFVPVLALRFMMGFNSVFFTRRVATTADGLDLGSYGAEGVRVVMSLYGALGVALMLISLIGVVALVRYRSMIPFLYLVLLIQQVAGKALNAIHPTHGSGAATPASSFVLGVLALTLVGFLLSLRGAPQGRSVPAR